MDEQKQLAPVVIDGQRCGRSYPSAPAGRGTATAAASAGPNGAAGGARDGGRVLRSEAGGRGGGISAAIAAGC
jgi:hypothetical protein